jgi:transposase
MMPIAACFLRLFMCETLVKRLLSLVLLAAGLPNARVTALTGYCDRSVRQLRKEIADGNAENIFRVKGGGRKSKLLGVEQAIVDEINTNNYHSRQQIVDMIEEKFGLKISLSAIWRFLKKKLIKFLKCGSLPAKADPAAQRTFHDGVLRPLMEKARQGAIAALFVDASHFVMGRDFLGYVYGAARRFVKTFSGRKRYNVLGALDLVSKTITAIKNDSYINAASVCDLLRKIAVEYAGTQVSLILDNASCQKCKIVRELADTLGISLVYIPPYSPNLNLIERFWKHVKARLRAKYYDDFSKFCGVIDDIAGCSDNRDKKAVDELISEKVQLFDDLMPIGVSTFVSNAATKKAA